MQTINENDINKAWQWAENCKERSLGIVQRCAANETLKYLLTKAFENISIAVEVEKVSMLREWAFGCIAATVAADAITAHEAAQLNLNLLEQAEARTAYVCLARAAAVR